MPYQTSLHLSINNIKHAGCLRFERVVDGRSLFGVSVKSTAPNGTETTLFEHAASGGMICFSYCYHYCVTHCLRHNLRYIYPINRLLSGKECPESFKKPIRTRYWAGWTIPDAQHLTACQHACLLRSDCYAIEYRKPLNLSERCVIFKSFTRRPEGSYIPDADFGGVAYIKWRDCSTCLYIPLF